MTKVRKVTVGLLLVLLGLGACQGVPSEEPKEATVEIQLHVLSKAFEDTGAIPGQYTCDGDDVSPPLAWSDPPPGAQSLILVCDDPDAPMGTWTHWVLFDVPASLRSLPEAVEGVGVPGLNSWGDAAYGGPCPPKGTVHRYVFRLYALDQALQLEAGASKKAVEEAMQGHILAEGQLVGRYGR